MTSNKRFNNHSEIEIVKMKMISSLSNDLDFIDYILVDKFDHSDINDTWWDIIPYYIEDWKPSPRFLEEKR